jgi:hypothetical protein
MQILKQEVALSHARLLRDWNRLIQKHQKMKEPWTTVKIVWRLQKFDDMNKHKHVLYHTAKKRIVNDGVKIIVGIGMINRLDDVRYFYIGIKNAKDISVRKPKVIFKGAVGEELKVDCGFTGVRHNANYYFPLMLRGTSQECRSTDFQRIFQATPNPKFVVTFEMKGSPVVRVPSDD